MCRRRIIDDYFSYNLRYLGFSTIYVIFLYLPYMQVGRLHGMAPDDMFCSKFYLVSSLYRLDNTFILGDKYMIRFILTITFQIFVIIFQFLLLPFMLVAWLLGWVFTIIMAPLCIVYAIIVYFYKNRS